MLRDHFKKQNYLLAYSLLNFSTLSYTTDQSSCPQFHLHVSEACSCPSILKKKARCSPHQLSSLFPCLTCLIFLHNKLLPSDNTHTHTYVVYHLPWLLWHTLFAFLLWFRLLFLSHWNILGPFGLCPRPIHHSTHSANFSPHDLYYYIYMPTGLFSQCQGHIQGHTQPLGWLHLDHSKGISDNMHKLLFSKFVQGLVLVLFYFE